MQSCSLVPSSQLTMSTPLTDTIHKFKFLMFSLFEQSCWYIQTINPVEQSSPNVAYTVHEAVGSHGKG